MVHCTKNSLLFIEKFGGNSNMKKIVLVALVFLLVFSLAACGDNAVPDTSAPDTSGNNSPTPPATNNGGAAAPTDSEAPEAPETPETPEMVEETARPPASAELSAEWSSFQFELEGKIYTLPIRYSELEANGWVAENAQDMDEILEAGKYILNYQTMVYSDKENSEIAVQFANLGDEDVPLSECHVSGIQFSEYSWNKDTVLYFPGGFTIGSTQEEVEALYGEPSETQELSSTVEWKYKTQIYDDVIFTFTKESGKIEKMRISNIYLL
jgi:hypothetical protein